MPTLQIKDPMEPTEGTLLTLQKKKVKKKQFENGNLLTLCKNGNLIDIMQKKANLKMETVHEFVQKLQPF